MGNIFLSEEQKNNYNNYGAIVIKQAFVSWIENLQKGFICRRGKKEL